MLKINLLPWREQRKSERQVKRLLEAGGAALLALIILLLLHSLLSIQLKKAAVRLDQTQNGLARVSHSLEELRRLYQELDYQKPPAFDLGSLLHHQREVLVFLQKLAQNFPQEMRMNKLSLDEKGFALEAVSTILAKIPEFAERLKVSFQEKKEGAPRADKFLNIKQRNGLFYYQLRFETLL